MNRIESMKYVAPTGSTLVIDHVAGKGFRSRGVIKANGMSAKDLNLFVRTIEANGYSLVEVV